MSITTTKPPPTPINNGLAVTSTSTSSLNGTYACDSLTQQAMQAECNAMLLSGESDTFADGSTSLNWPDKSGATHAFNPTQFHNLVVAISNFVVGCFQYGHGVTSTPPATSATIA